MGFEEKAGLICVTWSIFLILSIIFIPPVWHGFLWLLASGNIFFKVLGLIGITTALVGLMIILYNTISYIVYALIIAFSVGTPAMALYHFLGLEHSIVIALIIALIVILYLLETRTVRVEHHTVTVSLHRRLVVKK
ncbi:hypothetical protein IX51_02280 [uncultured archaeon]|nr:hypothetical protein IX51_02280 [uncultured archaeon]